MYYAVVYYLESYSPKIDQFRRKHDPRVEVTRPHVTLLFPIGDSIDEKKLINHITKVLKDWKAFHISLAGVTKSWDNYIFLTVSSGKEQVIKLHDALYTGMLSKYLREDIEFIPHVTIGQEEAESRSTLREATALQMKETVYISKVYLIRCSDDKTPHEWEKVFVLA